MNHDSSILDRSQLYVIIVIIICLPGVKPSEVPNQNEQRGKTPNHGTTSCLLLGEALQRQGVLPEVRG